MSFLQSKIDCLLTNTYKSYLESATLAIHKLALITIKTANARLRAMVYDRCEC